MYMAGVTNCLKFVGLCTFLLMLGSCSSTRYDGSTVHPCVGKAYQECGVELARYKSPQLRAGQDAGVAVALAASGGGFRATNFAAGILVELEHTKCPDGRNGNLLDQVDYFSTVSGGGFAASTYLSSLYNHMNFGGPGRYYSYSRSINFPSGVFANTPCECPEGYGDIDGQLDDPCLKRHMQGFYSTTMDNVIADVTSWATRNFFKKGGRVEGDIDSYLLGSKWRGLKIASLDGDTEAKAVLRMSDVFVGAGEERDVTLPFWVTNATVYENGAIFAFTPDHMKLYKVMEYRHNMVDHAFDGNSQSYDDYVANIPLAVGVMASANFPGATFPTTLRSSMDPQNPYVHLYDGGMADNLGAITAVRLLQNEQCEQVEKKVLIVVDSFGGQFAPFSQTSFAPPPLRTAIRALDISLDSWRGRYREVVTSMCEASDIEVVYLTFDGLVEMDGCDELMEFGLTASDIEDLSGRYEDLCPFKIARSINTLAGSEKGCIGKAEQNLLLAAGRYVTAMNTGKIMAALEK